MFILIVQSLYSQRWDVTIGSQNRADFVRNLEEYYDKGFLIIGGYDNEYGWAIKTDINGSVLWEKVFENSHAVFNNASAIDLNGNLYQCGALWIDESTCWPYIAKLDSCGNKVWCRSIKDNGKLYGWSCDIKLNNNNELIVLVEFESEEKIDQIFLYGLDTMGNILWSSAYASKNNYPQIGIASPRELSAIGAGYIISGYCYWPFPNNPQHKYLRPFFIGIDSNYNEKWILPYAVMDSVFGEAYSCIQLNDSINIGVGERWIEENSKNSIIMFINNDGENLGLIQIQNQMIGEDIISNTSSAIAKLNDSVLITSSIWGYSDTGILSEMVLDINGVIYNKHESINNAIFDSYLIKTNDNAFVVSGTINISNYDWDIVLYKINDSLESVPLDTNQYNYDSLCPHHITSGTIDLSDCLIWTNTEEIPSPEGYYASLRTIPISTFPNPAKDKVTFAFENTDKHKNIRLACFNIFGQRVHEQKIYTGQLEAEADVSEWGNGIYVAVVKSNGKTLGRTKFIVE